MFLVAVPLIRGVPPWVSVVPASLLFAGLSMGLMGAGGRLALRPLLEALLAIGLVAAWLTVDRAIDPKRAGVLYLRPLATVLFLLACLFLGRLLSRIVRERAMALPVAVVAGLGDVFTVFFGPTGQALAKAPALVQKLSLAIPAAGSAAGPAGARGLAYVATMGLGDFIFLAMFLAIAARFGFSVRRSFWAMAGCAAVGIVLALVVPAIAGMPLLPYMSLGFLWVNRKEFRLSPTERRDMAIGLGFMVALFVVAGVALRG